MLSIFYFGELDLSTFFSRIHAGELIFLTTFTS